MRLVETGNEAMETGNEAKETGNETNGDWE